MITVNLVASHFDLSMWPASVLYCAAAINSGQTVGKLLITFRGDKNARYWNKCIDIEIHPIVQSTPLLHSINAFLYDHALLTAALAAALISRPSH